MSDEEQESGCDTVDGSPTSDSSGHDSPFAESSFVEDTHQNAELVTSTDTETKPAVCTVVVPPMGLENGLNADEHMANTGKLSPLYFPDGPLKGLNLGTSEPKVISEFLTCPWQIYCTKEILSNIIQCLETRRSLLFI